MEETGAPEMMGLAEVPTPHPSGGEVRVRVVAAGVQPADLAARRGAMPPGAGPPGGAPIVGNEFAGVVDEVGEGMDGLDR